MNVTFFSLHSLYTSSVPVGAIVLMSKIIVLGLANDKTPSVSVITDLTFSVEGNIVITISAFLIVSLRELPGVPPTFTTGSIFSVTTS